MPLAGKTTDGLSVYGKGQLLLAGSFAPNGSSAVAQSDNKGSTTATTAWASTGTFTVTTNVRVKAVIAILPGVQLNSAANLDRTAQIGAITSLAPLTFTIRIMAGTSATDIAADPSNRINWQAVVQTGATK
jgi:hypothetical protein